MAHLDHLIQVTGIQAGQQVLNLGCGNGVSYANENGVHGRYLYRVDLAT